MTIQGKVSLSTENDIVVDCDNVPISTEDIPSPVVISTEGETICIPNGNHEENDLPKRKKRKVERKWKPSFMDLVRFSLF